MRIRMSSGKFLLLVVVSIISVICAEHTKALAAESTTPSRNEKNYFLQMKGCFLLYNMKKKAFGVLAEVE